MDESIETAPSSAIIKTMAILEAFQEHGQALGTRAVARNVGLPKSTVHRMLRQMESVGFLDREGSNYRISLKLLELGNYAAYCEPGGMRDTAMPFLTDLYVRGGDCTVCLAMPFQNRILCVEKLRGHASPRAESRAGRPLPPTTSSPGKVILAFSPPALLKELIEGGLPKSTEYSVVQPRKFMQELESIREAGLAVDNQESILGLSGVAAPVFRDGKIVASIGLTQRTSSFDLPYASSILRDTANRLGKALDRGSTRKAYVPLQRIG